jgi:FtsP/CotA-like multicopper oxidase with cupredoxin domain
MKISRRKAIELGLIGSGCFGLSLIGKQFFSPTSKKIVNTPFQLPLKIPPVLQPVRSDPTTDYYQIAIQKAKLEIIPGFETEIWGYNGISPAPTIRQKEGRKSVVRFINQLDRDRQQKEINTVVHVHGMASATQYDGYAMDYIPPNYYKDYIYPNDRASTLWYHDHAMDLTWRNVYMGLLGMYIVENPSQLTLPKGDYDIPLILEEKQFALDGSLIFNNNKQKSLHNGKITLINGTPSPRLEVANRKYRFRILNGSATKYYKLVLSQDSQALTQDEQLIVIGSDGGLLDKPITLSSSQDTLRMAMAERYEVVIDFSKYPVGTQLYLHDVKTVNNKTTVNYLSGTKAIMRFDVVRQEQDDSSIPDRLRPFTPIPVTAAVKTRTFTYDQVDNKWGINGKTWDMNRIDLNANPGDIEIWNLVNPQDDKRHPIHMHLLQAHMLDRNGKPPLAYEQAWKDVFHLGPSETVRVIVKYGDKDNSQILGKYMMHCHDLQHEDNGMMSQFEVGKTGVDPIATAPARSIENIQPL